jgi:hypothetical protein
VTESPHSETKMTQYMLASSELHWSLSKKLAQICKLDAGGKL